MYRQVIVSGFHRSGTSMTMQALVKAGLHAGSSLIGIDAKKSALRKTVSVLKTELQTELEDTWEQLQNISALPSAHSTQIQWLAPQAAEADQSTDLAALIMQWNRLGVAQSPSA